MLCTEARNAGFVGVSGISPGPWVFTCGCVLGVVQALPRRSGVATKRKRHCRRHRESFAVSSLAGAHTTPLLVVSFTSMGCGSLQAAPNFHQPCLCILCVLLSCTGRCRIGSRPLFDPFKRNCCFEQLSSRLHLIFLAGALGDAGSATATLFDSGSACTSGTPWHRD